MSSVPTLGLLSLAVTFLFFARLMVPAGTMKSGRLPLVAGSRLGTLRGAGVPTKSGAGNWVLRTTWSCANAAVVTRSTGTTGKILEIILNMVLGSHFFG